MTKAIVGLVCLCGMASVGWPVEAGDMEPPGPPGPTMVTLQQIYDKLDCPVGGGAGVPKTGQTGCWGEWGESTECAGTGQDGEHQAGVSVIPRFGDPGEGTVRDNLTGLIWLQDADCFVLMTWSNALAAANSLAAGACDLTDGSSAGDWRLANVKELQSLIDYSEDWPALPDGHPFHDVQNEYWSSTTNEFQGMNDWAWFVRLSDGYVSYIQKFAEYGVLAVRDGR